MALPAGSSKALCGASIPAKRLNDRDFSAITFPIRETASAKLRCHSSPPLLTAYGEENSGLLAPQSHNDVDARDLITFGRNRRVANHHIAGRNVEQLVLVLDEKVMVHRIVGVEISP